MRSQGRLRGCLLALVLVGVFASVPAPAQTPCQGDSCLPTTGYTYDTHWNCGGFYGNQVCYQPGACLNYICADAHTFGWGSADYDGSASLNVRIAADPATATAFPSFSNSGGSLARACRRRDCVDTDLADQRYWERVSHDHLNHAHTHTIKGHGKA